ncbi:hypothetical protein B0I35DRAFT_442340 [Stachybotrys elegans]|uniref:Uncharacterized protein n=1 Tax=Stachybotrys elegans TaxID=80388 RepID=A0A8K0SIN2_9HYPO|nr:hypothetical protein B0I35DRAFT_442340 [Stachybotrys elegans]
MTEPRSPPSASIVLFWIALFGLGMSVGRYISPVPERQSLANSIAVICSRNENVQSSDVCQTIFAVGLDENEWIEDVSKGMTQEKLDAEFLSFVSFAASEVRVRDICGTHSVQTTCRASNTLEEGTEQCSVNGAFTKQPRNSTGPALSLSPTSFNGPQFSIIWRRLTYHLSEVFTWSWKLLGFSLGAILVQNMVGPRYIFWPWVCFPWIWFFKDAPGIYLVAWYAFSGVASDDLAWRRVVPRSMIMLLLVSVSAATFIWYYVKGSREVSFYLVCFLLTAIPLEPLMDMAVIYIYKDEIAKATQASQSETSDVAG